MVLCCPTHMTPYPRHVPASVLSCGVRRRGFLRDIEHTSTLPDWPAPDEPAALFPSAGVGAVGLALEGRVDPRCEPMEGAVRNGAGGRRERAVLEGVAEAIVCRWDLIRTIPVPGPLGAVG